MRISYTTLTHIANSGDVEAMNLMTQWEKLGNPDSPTMNFQAKWLPEWGFFLMDPKTKQVLPKPMTPPLPAPRGRMPTLLGMPAVKYPDVIILDDDGEID